MNWTEPPAPEASHHLTTCYCAPCGEGCPRVARKVGEEPWLPFGREPGGEMQEEVTFVLGLEDGKGRTHTGQETVRAYEEE